MKEYEVISMIKDIQRETGIDIRVKCRKRENFYSRVVVFRVLKERKSILSLEKIGLIVNTNHTAVMHTMKAYENLKNYPDFKEIERNIRNIIRERKVSTQIYCNQIPYPNVQN